MSTKRLLSAVTLALTIAAVWGLRRAGMDDATADTILTVMVAGLGLGPSALPRPKS